MYMDIKIILLVFIGYVFSFILGVTLYRSVQDER